MNDILVVIAICTTCVGCCGKSGPNPSTTKMSGETGRQFDDNSIVPANGWTRLTDTGRGFHLYFPPGWKVDTDVTIDTLLTCFCRAQ